jgi:hypothetical protein
MCLPFVLLLPPLGEGGDGGGARQQFQLFKDYREHAFQIDQRLIGREAKHCEAMGPHVGIAVVVIVLAPDML